MISPTAKMTQPSLADLTARFLARPAGNDAELAVEPHEVVAGFTTDARTTWNEAVAAAKLLGVKDVPHQPGDWSAYARQAASAEFLPLALGHFPQQVREITSLLSAPKKSMAAAENRSWNSTSAKSTVAGLLLSAAAARIGGQFAEARRLLAEAEQLAADDSARALVENEHAALLWQTGDRTAALAIWKQRPEGGIASFNLGMAFLAEGQKAEAQLHLKAAVAKLPESTGWHHLAQLYLALT